MSIAIDNNGFRIATQNDMMYFIRCLYDVYTMWLKYESGCDLNIYILSISVMSFKPFT
jgi:hypothetical protein